MAYEQITPIQQLNFQINRVLTYGEVAGDHDEIVTALSGVRDLDTWFSVWRNIGQRAEQKNRYMHAAYAYRMAEFFLKETHPEKERMYEKAIENFYKAFDVLHIPYTICDIPYKGAFLHSVKVGEQTNTKILLVCGGYDSFIEEFIRATLGLLDQGYTLLFFEGDGQGKTLKYGLPLTYAWEEPTKCVLDYYQINHCPMIGISWGGYFVMRAAAFEKRISAVVAYDVADDGLEIMTNVFPPILRRLIRWVFAHKQEKLVNHLVRFAMHKSVLADWALSQGQYITHTKSPYRFYQEVQKHTLRGVCDRITQDCLLLAGEKDHYIPIDQFERLQSSLPNARSVKKCVFTQAEGGEQHCQIGNHQLALNEITQWLEGLE